MSLITIHRHYHTNAAEAERSRLILDYLGAILENTEEIMSTFEDLKAKQDATDALIVNVASDIKSLLEKLANVPAAGMTPEQQAALDDAVLHAQAINESLSVADQAASA